MRNRPIVKRLRAYTSTRSWAKLKVLTKQIVIDAFITNDDPLSVDEIAQLDSWGKIAFDFLKNEWVLAQHEDFIANKYIPAFKSDINPSMSSYTVRQVYEYTLNQGLSEETAQAVYKKAVALYHGELNG